MAIYQHQPGGSRLGIILLLLWGALQAQEFPTDTLAGVEEVPPARKAFLVSLALYQKVSHAVPVFNCQFEPSCSHYMAQSISRYGVARGLLTGADRIVRCNPFAIVYYFREHPDSFDINERLYDPVPQDEKLRPPNLSTLLSIVPGLGRIRDGRIGDGLASFAVISAFAAGTYNLYARKKPLGTAIYGSITFLFWLGDFYSTMKPRREPARQPKSF